MACYHPISGYEKQDGSFTYNARYGIRPMVVPCQGCVGCRRKRAGEWTVRGTHEASLYLDNCFVTLTFDDKLLPARDSWQIPANVGLHYPEFQGFLYRLRDKYGSGIRYMVCGEYGDKLGRPHYHAIFFNFNFPDRKKWYRSKQGHQVYTSESLTRLWGYGNCDLGSVTPQSIGYVSRYVMKKINGKLADNHYEWHDPSTGELFWRKPEFAEYSLRPGIGHDWFMKYHASVFPHDYVIFNGKKVRPPRYYDKLYSKMTGVPFRRDVRLDDGRLIGFDIREFSSAFDEIKLTRLESLQKCLDDNTPERLLVREQVALAQLSRLKRKLT